ncbi:GSCOCG00011182001-RA-CDS, partial [Cotesia congregata]
MLPINVVERPSFRQIFDDLQVKKGESQLQHLSRYSLGKRIKTYFDKSFNEIRQHLESVTTNNGFVCTTADVWTSGSRRFLGVTMSWIDQKSLARKSDAVACKRFLGTHSFDAIAKKLFDIHSSFGLTSENIRATVTDNGSNFIKAFKEFGVDVSDKDLFDSSEVSCDDNDEEIFDALDDISVRAEEEFDLTCEIALPQHLRCASHTLNLIATTDISKGIEASQVLKKRHTNVVKKCSSLWKQLRSPKKNE